MASGTWRRAVGVGLVGAAIACLGILVLQARSHPSYSSVVLRTPGLVSYWPLHDRPSTGWSSFGRRSPSFVGDFDTCDRSQWHDFHDAHLSSATPGVQVERPDSRSAGCHARIRVTDQGDSSSRTGDGSMLWEGNGDNAYVLPHLQPKSDTWFRMQILFPDDRDPAHPGTFTPAPAGGWDIVEEWHEPPGAGYSSVVGVQRDAQGRPALGFRPVGGPASSQVFTYWLQTDGTARPVGLQANHWYDIVVHIVFGVTRGTGFAEWWVDGVRQNAQHVPTLTSWADGSVPGVGHAVGLYRGPREFVTDTLYLDGVVDGPTAGSVGLSTAVDRHRGHDGKFVGATSLGHAGDAEDGSSRAATFNGIDDAVAIRSDGSLGFTRAYTAEAWVTPFARFSGRAMAVVAKRNAYGLFVDRRGRFQACLRRATDPCARATVVARAGRTYYLAGTYDGTRLCLYVNARRESCVAGTGPMARSRNPVRIGVTSPDLRDYWHGTIADVALYRRALTSSQIRQHFAARSR
jgi:hypothetical protein